MLTAMLLNVASMCVGCSMPAPSPTPSASPYPPREAERAATIDCGSHRPVTSFALCPVIAGDGGRTCERCYDAELLDVGQWRIGYEAAFHGTNQHTGEEVCFTISGDFFLPLDPTGASRDPDF